MSHPYKHAVHTWMFGGLPLEEIAEHLTSIGFYMDLAMQYQGSSTPEKIIESRQRANTFKNIEIPVCTAMFMGNELNLSDRDPALRNQAISFAKRCIEAAACVGSNRLLVSPSGITTGHRYSRSRDADWCTAVESLQDIGAFAGKYGVCLMIEPINRYRVALVHTVAEALRMAEETHLDNIGVVPDVFHMCMEETAGVPAAIRSAGSRLLCLHIGGNTRNVPGMDAFEWAPILQALHEIHYEGVLSYEPVKLYFDEVQTGKDAAYCKAFLKELQRGKEYLDQLEEQLPENPPET